VAIAAVAEHLVADYEGVKLQREWDQHGEECLQHLQIGKAEAGGWVDALYPIFEGTVLS
jgi:hypothetical protein